MFYDDADFNDAEFVESTARTNKLKCNDCHNKINKGEEVVFALDNTAKKSMLAVFCSKCKSGYMKEVIYSQIHPHDIDDY